MPLYTICYVFDPERVRSDKCLYRITKSTLDVERCLQYK
jgi:hypothetical protein